MFRLHLKTNFEKIGIFLLCIFFYMQFDLIETSERVSFEEFEIIARYILREALYKNGELPFLAVGFIWLFYMQP